MFKLFLLAYSLLYLAALILYLPFLGLQSLRGGKRSSIIPRLYCFGKSGMKKTPGELRIWIQAVSVGEVNAIRPLAKAFIDRGYRIFVSTTTVTGQKQAKEIFKQEAHVFYFPLDFKGICRRVLRTVQPDIVLLVETELWPNFISSATDLNIPLLLVNGRFSDRSFRNYLRFRPLVTPFLKRISHFCMQSRQDKERIILLGAKPELTNWVGNLKFDYTQPNAPDKEALRSEIAAILKPQINSLLWLCGSTKPGEEELLTPVFVNLKSDFPNLRLLLAPRHPHRGSEISDLLIQRGINAVLRSQLNLNRQTRVIADALILDTIGELAHLYPLADLVYMGGSLVRTGGQNIIEPAASGKPILFGPHMGNFREIAASFVENYAALQVSSAPELEQRLRDLLQDSNTRKWLGRNARRVIKNNQGAVRRTVQIVESYLGSKAIPS